MISKVRNWIPLTITITALCLFIYASVQQDIRQSANDPQIQIAEDLRESLNSGKKIEELITVNNIDLNKSLASFVIIFDEQDHPVSSQASLDGKMPVPPAGVFEYVGRQGQERFTWQPKQNVRIAAVVVKYSKGYILVGRSLREVEKRENWILTMAGITWVGTLFVTFVASLIFSTRPSYQPN